MKFHLMFITALIYWDRISRIGPGAGLAACAKSFVLSNVRGQNLAKYMSSLLAGHDYLWKYWEIKISGFSLVDTLCD